MKEDRLQEDIELGDSAQQCFDNEALQEAFDRLKRNYIAMWTGSAPSEGSEAREKLYYAHQAVEYVERELRIMLDNGRLAASEIERNE